jgi:hypothetical protein
VQPKVSGFDLVAVLDVLAKDALVIAQAIANGRNLQGGQGTDEASWETPEAAVA